MAINRGVGFDIRTELAKYPDQLQGISDRIVFLRILLFCDCYLTVLSVSAPTVTSPEESIMAFYQYLTTAVTKVPRTDKILLLDDFDARVGKNYRNSEGIWKARPWKNE